MFLIFFFLLTNIMLAKRPLGYYKSFNVLLMVVIFHKVPYSNNIQTSQLTWDSYVDRKKKQMMNITIKLKFHSVYTLRPLSISSRFFRRSRRPILSLIEKKTIGRFGRRKKNDRFGKRKILDNTREDIPTQQVYDRSASPARLRLRP